MSFRHDIIVFLCTADMAGCGSSQPASTRPTQQYNNCTYNVASCTNHWGWVNRYFGTAVSVSGLLLVFSVHSYFLTRSSLHYRWGWFSSIGKGWQLMLYIFLTLRHIYFLKLFKQKYQNQISKNKQLKQPMPLQPIIHGVPQFSRKYLGRTRLW